MNSLKSRTTRRVLVVAMSASYLGMIVSGTLAEGRFGLQTVFFAFALVCFLFIVQAARAYGVSVRQVDGKPVDERMSLVRDRAQAYAYRIVSFLLLVAVAGWLPAPKGSSGQTYVFLALLLLTSSLPQALILWNEPPALPEDDTLDAPRPQPVCR